MGILGVSNGLLQVRLPGSTFLFQKLATVSSTFQFFGKISHLFFASAMGSLFGFQLFAGSFGSRIAFSGLLLGFGEFGSQSFYGRCTICIKHTQGKILT